MQFLYIFKTVYLANAFQSSIMLKVTLYILHFDPAHKHSLETHYNNLKWQFI